MASNSKAAHQPSKYRIVIKNDVSAPVLPALTGPFFCFSFFLKITIFSKGESSGGGGRGARGY